MDQIAVHAHEVNLAKPGTAVSPSHVIATAQLTQLSPNEIGFQIPHLKPLDMYELGVTNKSPSCPRISWRGPESGMIFPGQNNIAVTGLALQSTFTVTTTQSGTSPVSASADGIDWNDPADVSRSFQFATSIPGVTSVVVQASTNPFPTTETFDTCQAPPGLEGSGTLPVGSDGSATIGLNLSNLYTPIFNIHPVPLQNNLSLADKATLLTELNNGAPIYIRAFPADANGIKCDTATYGLAPTVTFVHDASRHIANFAAETIASPVQIVNAHYMPAQSDGIPSDETCYVTVQHHHMTDSIAYNSGLGSYTDHYDHILNRLYGFKPGDDIEAGSKFCESIWSFSNGDESLGDQLTAFGSGVVSVWQDIAQLYSEIESAIVQAVADVITATGIVDCDQTCKTALNVALAAALTALGIPPSLPDFKTAANSGLDYLAAAVISQLPVTIPSDVLSKVTNLVQGSITAATANIGVSPDDEWVAFDTGFTPAELDVTVEPNPADPGVIPTTLTQGDEQCAGSVSSSAPCPAFVPSTLPLPVLTGPLTIPIGLSPNFKNIPANPLNGYAENQYPSTPYGDQHYRLDRWFQSYDYPDRPAHTPFCDRERVTAGSSTKSWPTAEWGILPAVNANFTQAVGNFWGPCPL